MQGGSGLIFTEFDALPEVQPELGAWHSDEHVPERLAIPGVRSARRYASIGDPHHYCAFYRAETADVFAAPAYQALFANQSEATLRVTAGIKGTRFVGDIVREHGTGYGGLMRRFRISAEPAQDEAVVAWFDASLAALPGTPGFARVLLASPRRGLPNVTDPSWIALVEGYDAEALADLNPMIAGIPAIDALDFRLAHIFP